MTGLSQLSLTTCRRLLGASGTDLSDTELIRLVDQMSSYARVALTHYKTDGTQVESAALRLLPTDDREAIEERAAVLEFDAGMTRGEATRTALASYLPAARRRTRSR